MQILCFDRPSQLDDFLARNDASTHPLPACWPKSADLFSGKVFGIERFFVYLWNQNHAMNDRQMQTVTTVALRPLADGRAERVCAFLPGSLMAGGSYAAICSDKNPPPEKWGARSLI